MSTEYVIPEDLSIPEWMKRPHEGPVGSTGPARPARAKKIPYPKDGYKCFGLREKARARHKEKLRRRAERMMVR